MASDSIASLNEAARQIQQLALNEARERLRKARAEADTAEMVRDATAKAVREYDRNMKLPDLPKGVS